MVAQSILPLNASYEPLTVVTLARAVKLLLRGRAEHVTVASAAQTLAVPQVLRLKIYAHVRIAHLRMCEVPCLHWPAQYLKLVYGHRTVEAP